MHTHTHHVRGGGEEGGGDKQNRQEKKREKKKMKERLIDKCCATHKKPTERAKEREREASPQRWRPLVVTMKMDAYTYTHGPPLFLLFFFSVPSVVKRYILILFYLTDNTWPNQPTHHHPSVPPSPTALYYCERPARARESRFASLFSLLPSLVEVRL